MRPEVVVDIAPHVARTAAEPAHPRSPLPETRRLLVVCAHPFDVTVTLGGVIAAFADTGTAVQVICLTHDQCAAAGEGRRPVRAAELLRAAGLLGAREATLLEHRAAHLQWNPPEVLAAELRSVSGPVDGVLTIDASAPDSHPDLVRAMRAARRVAARLRCPLYAWVPRTWGPDDPPANVLPVDCDRAKQRAAIACHDAPRPDDPCTAPAGADEPRDYLTVL
ncbi:PIG-L deacetylase family protein [Promicromonospora sp. NPDC060204]|uniref:PIG-L deacetylase family protein n=1 Tax=Promicromonospora sp. NPDC060204 TaxID=3347071 RepID=UPI00365E9461